VSVCVCLCVTCLFHFTMGLYLIQINGLDWITFPNTTVMPVIKAGCETRPLVKCGCADADFTRVKCREILRRLSVDAMGRVTVRFSFSFRDKRRVRVRLGRG